MDNWGDLDKELRGLELGKEAGEWAVIALALMVLADGRVDERELERVRQIVSRASVIRESLAPAEAEQLFLDTIEQLRQSPEQEEVLRDRLGALASRVSSQPHRDHAFQTLVVIATADHSIVPSEHRLLKELREMIGAEVMVPMPHLTV